MQLKYLFVTLTVFLSLFLLNFAQAQQHEPRTVRLIYFLPNDRPFQADVVQKIKNEIRTVQTFYAEQMQAHGYGNKTFRFETDATGNPKVHHVNGKHPFSHYDNTLGTAVVEELEQVFDFEANIYFVVLGADALRQSNGQPAGGVGSQRGKNGGSAVVPNVFGWSTVAHELGHAFGLGHDFRDDSYIMSYGHRHDTSLSACAAEFLSVHPYFNPRIPIAEVSPPIIELLSSRTYLPGSESIPIQLKITDSEGIHQVQLHAGGGLQEYRGLAGKKETIVEFEYNGSIGYDYGIGFSDFTSLSDAVSHNIGVKAVDIDGNVGNALFQLVGKSPHHITTLKAHTDVVNSLTFSPDGQTLASGSRDGDTKLWDLATRDNIATLVHGSKDRPYAVESVSFSPDGMTLASGGTGHVKLWDLATGRNIATLDDHGQYPVGSVSFSPDGKTLAFAESNNVWLWDLTTGRNIATLVLDHKPQNSVKYVSFSPDWTTFASFRPDDKVKLWDLATGSHIATFQNTDIVSAVSFSPDGKTLASGTFGAEVTLWDLATKRNIATLDHGVISVWSVSFSPNGMILASGNWYSEVNLWDIATGSHIATFPNTDTSGSRRYIPSIAFSPDGKTLASGKTDGTVDLWDMLDLSDLAAQLRHPVTIPDDNLRSKIAEKLNKSVDVQLRAADMLRLTGLYVRNANIRDLTGLEYAHNLGRLYLGAEYIDGEGWVNSNAISDFTSLAALTNLRTLDLSECSLSDISPLADLTQLTDLGLERNNISDISALSGLTQLTDLGLDHNNISDISALSGLTQLTDLGLERNNISDISALSGLMELKVLNLLDNTISDVSPLVGLNLTGTGWSRGLDIQLNPLSYASINTHIPAMQAKGVEVWFNPRTPTTLLKISGTGQQGIANTTLPLPFVVEVRDQRNRAFAGVPVTFTVVTGGGKLSATTVPTDAAGRASAHLTLGRTAGTTTIHVAAAKIAQPVQFTATAVLLSEPVAITDANLRGKIVETLDKPRGETLTVADMLKLTTLVANNANIRDLTGLQHAPNLKILFLDNNNLSDISRLGALTHLTLLSLTGNNISDVSSLGVLTRLDTLLLDNNNLSDVIPLAGLTQLKTLSLNNNSISNVAPLEALTQLKLLQLKGNLLSYPALHTSVPAIQASGATITVDLRTPTTLVKISGIHGVAGASLPFIVEVQDEQGLGFSGVPVTFTVTAGGGHLSDSNVITDSTGRARTTLTLGTTPGKNTVRAIAAQAPRPVSFTITAIDANSPVTIPDINLRAKIAEVINKPVSVQLTAGDMVALTELEAPNANIRDLTGLEQAYNLRNLDLGYEYIDGEGSVNSNTISDFSPIAGLTQLTQLDLSSGSISDVSFLSGLTQLTTLRLYNNPISDISTLSGLTQLTFLELSRTDISDVSPLVGLTQLTGLYLHNISLADIAALSSLTQLTNLGIGSNDISDISPLAGLTQLTDLYLWNNAISDVSPLESLTQLTYLHLSGNEISDISVLSGLTQLEVLNLSHNAILDVSPLVELDLPGTQWNSTGLYIEGNPLNYASVHTHIPAMQAKGIEIEFDNRTHSALAKISGDTQEGEAGTTLANPFVVEALDEHGVPITGRSVTFRVIEGNGRLSVTNAITDADGRAQITLTLGPNPGMNKIRVTASGITYPVIFTATATEASRLAADVNGDGIVNIQDLVLVSSNLGQTGQSRADVNGDGVVNIQDLVRVAGALGQGTAASPTLHASDLEGLTAAEVQDLLTQARQMALTDPAYLRGIAVLEQLLALLLPKETALFPNYPNPFNPETWMPYQLAKPAEVTLHIYAVNGKLVRILALGHQSAGKYQSRSRAVHWDGRNSLGEPVASGVYFYTLTAGDFIATRKMLIQK